MNEREKFEDFYSKEIKTKPFSTISIKETAYKSWQAATKAAVPEGWKIVPVEPTEDMIKKAQIEFFRNHPYENFDDWTVAGYKTMLEAAPEVK